MRREYFERALAMFQSLYPENRYPKGHNELAAGLNNMGFVLTGLGSYVEARAYYERTIAMNESVYSRDRYPQGHPNLAMSLNNMGVVLDYLGLYNEAGVYHERALTMRESLYPKSGYPYGHPDINQSLYNLGATLFDQGSYVNAAVILRRGADMQQSLARMLVAATSEAEARSYLAQLPSDLDALISVSLRVPGSEADTYRRVWHGKSVLTQVLHDRQVAAVDRAKTLPGVRQGIAAWRETRTRLARLVLATADGRDRPRQAAMIADLSRDKERMERDLAAAVPDFSRQKALEQSDYADLLKVLPMGTAVVDLLRFTRFEQDPQIKGKKGRRTDARLCWICASIGPACADGGPRAGSPD